MNTRMRQVVCVSCGKMKEHYAKGKCWSCWQKGYQKTDKYKAYHKAYQKVYQKIYQKTDAYTIIQARCALRKLPPKARTKLK